MDITFSFYFIYRTTIWLLSGLLFIAIVVCFKFFTANWNFSFFIQGNWLAFNIYVPLGWVLRAAAWGLLFWYYSELIYSTAFNEDKLPKVFLEGFYGMIWKIIRSLYTIFAILIVVGLPYFLMALIFWAAGLKWPAFLYVFLFIGLFLSPMAILNVAIGRDLTYFSTGNQQRAITAVIELNASGENMRTTSI